jgi:hypothetical protein
MITEIRYAKQLLFKTKEGAQRRMLAEARKIAYTYRFNSDDLMTVALISKAWDNGVLITVCNFGDSWEVEIRNGRREIGANRYAEYFPELNAREVAAIKAVGKNW